MDGIKTSGALVATMPVSHPARLVDKSSGLTKLDLVNYYDSVAAWILPQLRGRPVAFVRGPGGVGRNTFFQRHDGGQAIPGLHQLDPALWPGHEALLEVRTAEGLLAAAQMNVIAFHTWNSTTRAIGKPDRVVFDLDPGEGVDFAAMRDAARATRDLLQSIGLRSWLKTSGGKGLHVVVPIAARRDHDAVRDFSQAVARRLAADAPAQLVATSGPKNRKGRIYVDYQRNGIGATTVAAYSARARPGVGVSVPIGWDELDTLESANDWTVANVVERLARRIDPWAEMDGCRQALTAPIEALGRGVVADG